MSLDTPRDDAALVRAAVRRTMLRVLPPVVLGYLLLLLDQAAIRYVAPQVGQAFGLEPLYIGLTTPILFLGVLLFEVPSALISGRVGARRWLAMLAVAWGAASLATGLAAGPGMFYAARIVASLAQAGFLPVGAFLVAGCVPQSHRTRAMTWLVLGGLAGSLLESHAAALLAGLQGMAGLAGWRWVFLGLGAAAMPVAALLLRRLPDQPTHAPWLPREERDALAWARSVEPRWTLRTRGLEALLDPRILLLAGMNFCFSLSNFAAGSWYAALMQDPRAPRLALTLVFLAATVATLLLWSRRTDRTGRLFDALVFACVLSAVAFLAGVYPGPTIARLAGLVAHAAILATARTMLLSAGSRMALGGGGAAALALIDATGMVGGYVAPRMVFGVVQQAGNLQIGLMLLTTTLVAATGLAWLLKLLMRR